MTTPFRIVLIPHVYERAKKRGISEEQIRAAIAAPDSVLAARPNARSRAPRRKHVKAFGRKRLCVVIEFRGTDRIAITTYWKES